MTQPDPAAQSGSEGTGALSGAGDNTGTPPVVGAQTGTDPGTQGGAPAANAEATVSRAEFDQLRAQLQAADRKRNEAEVALRQIRDKDLPEAEKAKRDLEELQQKNQKLEADLRDQAIDTAFMADTTHNWQDPKAARQLLELGGVTVGEDRTVVGMKDAVKRLAAAYPFLVKPAETGSSGAEGTTAAGSGAPPMNGRTGTTQPDRAQLARRFPALRTRTGG